MSIRVAINGFGRIGRMVFKAASDDPAVDVIAVNDLTDTKTLANLLKYDSVHGKFDGVIEVKPDRLIVDDKELLVFAEKDPSVLPWGKLGIDCVVESTGFFRTRSLISKHITAGAKKVLVSAPCRCEKNSAGVCEIDVKTIVLGVNEHAIDKEKDILLSNASCTTNCAAPMFKVLNDNFRIIHGGLTTIHAYTSDQRIIDAPHKDLRRGRDAAINIIPTTTGAATTVTEIIPELKGRLEGISIRVPVADGSISVVTAEVEKDVTVEEVNKLFKDVSDHHLKGIVEYTEEPLVSSDIIDNPHSLIFDAAMTRVVDKRMIKIFGWYDNEYGYSCRMVDVIKMMF